MVRAEHDWLESVRALVLRSDLASAQATLNQALTDFPDSIELRRAQAGILQRTGNTGESERILRALLMPNPEDVPSAFALVRLLKEQGRTAAAAEVLRACFAAESNLRNTDLVITAIELLVDCDRHRDAAAIIEDAIAKTPDDPRLHAYAGMLAVQLGDFRLARRRYEVALQRDSRACEWHVPIGLSSTLRYVDAAHPDFALFHAALQRGDLSDLARAELHFALGKANDDLREHAEAAQHFRRGNDIRHRLTKWSRKTWRRTIEARLGSPRLIEAAPATEGFTPLFIVGMPRTGTTLLAELLSRHPKVCNRGELPWLARLAQQSDLSGVPDRPVLRHAASRYAAQARQDDAPYARWFIDKQPLNFRYIDLALAMFPDARFIQCRRNARDTALSIWTQCFLEEVQGYSYDFNDIALVMQDEQRLMARWHQRYPDVIRVISYEELVTNPEEVVSALAAWLGLPVSAKTAVSAPPVSTISTASLWQARQPVHPASVGRWQRYAPYLPELARIPET